MANVFDYVPSADGVELEYLRKVFASMNDEEARRFMGIYTSQRRDYTLMLVLTILGFFSIAGLQRFATNDIGMGILYFFTGGLCLIGTIVDLVNLKDITNNYNVEVASDVLARFNQRF